MARHLRLTLAIQRLINRVYTQLSFIGLLPTDRGQAMVKEKQMHNLDTD